MLLMFDSYIQNNGQSTLPLLLTPLSLMESLNKEKNACVQGKCYAYKFGTTTKLVWGSLISQDYYRAYGMEAHEACWGKP